MDFSELYQAVKHRLDVVADHNLRDRDAAAHLQQLIAAAGRVDSLVRELPAGADPMLRHYLEKQSYVKALKWLEENR